MGKGRLEAFSDGVIAIIITIMVLEFKRPEALSLTGLLHVAPHFAIYILSFVYVGIYWNNHHHMFHAAKSVSGPILWANLHLLFWLSLVPYSSSWMGEHYTASLPVALYGINLLLTALAYAILARLLVKHEGPDSVMAKAIGKDSKTWWSLAAYGSAIALSFAFPPLSLAIYAGVALCWLIPDPRIERAIKTS
ncbi:MAG TPA: TMEM175 family protein [Rhizomicrobium sp.]|nr:TMEM175 family protein [Rhizomicrobium sp.]